MSIKNSHTTAEALSWDSMLILVNKLNKNSEAKMALLILVGSHLGLRISDLLLLKFGDIIGKDYIELTEKKTKKYRKIKIHENVKQAVADYYSNMPQKLDIYIFSNYKYTRPISVQFINKKLKEFRDKYSLGIKNVSSHMMRKTFGKRIIEKCEFKEKGLLMLSEIFNHQSPAVTRKYLGLREEQLMGVYDLL